MSGWQWVSLVMLYVSGWLGHVAYQCLREWWRIRRRERAWR